MKKHNVYIFILPLFFIGAFFLPFFYKFLFFLTIFFSLFLSGYKNFILFFKIYIGLFLSILPFVISTMFNHNEGKVYIFLGFKLYSFGIIKSINYFLNISLISLFSFFILKIFNFFEIFKNINFFKRFYFIILSIELYSKLINEFFSEIKNIKINKILIFIDNNYLKLKDSIHQSNES